MTISRTFAAAVLATALPIAALSGVAQATEIKIGIGMFEGDNPEYNALLRFKEYVEFRSNGDIQVRLFPGNQLGGEREMIEMVQQGSLEISFPADGAFAGFYPPIQVWSVPYLFSSAPVAWQVMNGPFAQDMIADIREQTGIRVLALSQNGFRSFTNNVRPIHTPEDMAGLRIRTMESPVYMRMVEALGATPTPISGAEVVMALRQGVVDGQENPPAVVYAGGAGEVQDYYTLNEHVLGLHLIIVNDDWFSSLPAGEQQIITDGAKLMAWTENLQKTEGDWKFTALLEEGGMEIHVSTPEEKEMFREATQAPVLEFIAGEVGQDLVDEMLAEVERAETALYGSK